MFKNYLKIAFRILIRQKTYTIINIAGLAIGLAASFIILLYVVYENSYDKFHDNYNHIYRITTKNLLTNWTEAKAPFSLATEMEAGFPEARTIARVTAIGAKIKTNTAWQKVKRFLTVDPSLHKILSIPLISGNWQAMKDNPNTVVISEDMAEQFFGAASPLGETIELDCFGDKYHLQIIGIMKNMPRNSTFKANFIAPLQIGEKYWTKRRSSWAKESVAEDWVFNMFTTYLLLDNGEQANQLKSKLPALVQKHQAAQNIIFALQPMAEFYFHSSDFVNYHSARGDLKNIYIYTAIAFLILLIAIINYIILSIARSMNRFKEVGARKVMGANRNDLMRQILGEFILLPLIALPFALVLIEFFLPSFSSLLGKKLETANFQNWPFFVGFLGITLVTGLLSGSYIAFYLSAFNPVETLKGKLVAKQGKPVLQKIFITVQMIIFAGLIVSSIIIYLQLRYFHNKDFGFNKEQIIVLDVYKSLGNKYEAFKSELKNLPGVVNVSATNLLPPTDSKSVWNIPSQKEPGKNIMVESMSVDFDFIETMEFKLFEGRTFSKDFPADKTDSYVVNQTLVNELGIEEPIGKSMFSGGKRKIIGVVRDFHLHSLREKIIPLSLAITDKYLHEIVIRLRSGEILNTIDAIKEKWAEFVPNKAPELSFFDERLDELYQDEKNFFVMIRYFTFLAIFIACLGLFGLTLFVSEQRTKEIGIRKVLGATSANVITLLTKDFVKLVLIANLIAWPIVWYAMNKWLQNFAYHIDILWWIFVLAGGLTLAITLLTVSTQAIKAALTNPVESLRYE